MIKLQEFTEVDIGSFFTTLDKIDEANLLENYYKQFLIDSEFYSTQVTEYSTEVAELQNNITALQKQAGNAIKLLYNLREDFVTSTTNLIPTFIGRNYQFLNTEIIPQLKVEIETKDGEINTKQGILSDTSASLNITQSNQDIIICRMCFLKRLNKKMIKIDNKFNITQIIQQYLQILFVMRGFFAITRAFIAPVFKQTFNFSSQQSKIQMRIVINKVNHLIRLSSTMSGLRIANQYDISLFSLLEDAQGNIQDLIILDDSTDLDNRQIGLHLGCTVSI